MDYELDILQPRRRSQRTGRWRGDAPGAFDNQLPTDVVIAGCLMAYHQWLARDREPAGCFRAFLQNHRIGLVVFVGIVLHYSFNPGA